jgi:hypothetical protein
MKLMTESQYSALLANGCAAREAARAGLSFDPKPIVKLITPGDCSRWLLTEIDPIDNDRAYGLCDLGDGRPDLGVVSLRKMETLRTDFGATVECDQHFVADMPLSAYAQIAYTRGLIIT